MTRVRNLSPAGTIRSRSGFLMVTAPSWPCASTEHPGTTAAKRCSPIGSNAFALSRSIWSTGRRWRYENIHAAARRRASVLRNAADIVRTLVVFFSLQMVYPENVKLSEEDKTNLCYLAFPDSNSGCMGDTQFHVKIKCSQPLNLSQRHINYNAKCPVFLQADHRCLYGFVFFRQIKDLSLPRGYFQKVR